MATTTIQKRKHERRRFLDLLSQPIVGRGENIFFKIEAGLALSWVPIPWSKDRNQTVTGGCTLPEEKFQTQEAKSRETKEAGIEDGIKEGNDERPPQRRKVRHEPKEVDDMVVLMKLPNCLDVVQHAEL
jgi:hypothetical protein